MRLEILRQLRAPRALAEIEVHGTRTGAGGTLARQSVREHLDRLLDAGIVIERPAERPHGKTTEFILNHQAIFALSEEVRGLARWRPVVDLHVDTAPLQGGPSHASRGPRLVVVKGLDEGVTFTLRAGEGDWVIGRRRGAPISLDFDPYVSADHAVVKERGAARLLLDLPDNKNGTLLNLSRVEKGVETPLHHGDLVTIGRTSLLYWV
jgi:DNA-binding transcriptional ArsR family regulator